MIRALIVQNDPVDAAIVETVLQGVTAWPEVTTAGGLQDARMAFEDARPPALLVLDQQLRDGTALSWLGQLRARRQSVAAVVIAERSDRAQLLEARRLGVAAWVQRPCDLDRLTANLTEVVRAQVEAGGGNDRPASRSERDSAGDPTPEQALKRWFERALHDGVPLPDWQVAESLAEVERAPEAVTAASLSRLWAHEPILHARLIDLANQRRFARSAEPLSTLRGAIDELGVDVALRYAKARQQRRDVAFEAAGFRERAEALFQRAKTLAERVNQRFVDVGLRDPAATTAALLHQAGEFAVLAAAQRTVREGAVIEPDALDALLASRWTARLGAAMKIRWRLPLCLKQRIGACYANGIDSGGPALKLMRLAMLDAMGQSDGPEALRLARQIEAQAGGRPPR